MNPKDPVPPAPMQIEAVPTARIVGSIFVLRGQKVILDSDLAAIYGVPTKRLNEAVKRNRDRFPEDFLLNLTAREHEILKSQIATSSGAHGGRRKLPWAFTEHGAIQAANVLNSKRAIAMGVFVVRAFVRLRDHLSSNKALASKLDELEARIARKLAAHDEAIASVLATMRELMKPTARKRRPIGFTADLEGSS